MAGRIKVIITDAQQEVKVPTGIRMLLRRACTAVLVYEQFEQQSEVGIRFVNNDEIRALNAKHRNIEDITDVLSFPMGENGAYDTNPESGALLLGDIVIALPRAAEQARLFGHSIQRELAYLTVHSMLHLLGYGHEAGGLESVRMREKEEQVLVQLGLPRGHNYIIQG